MEIRGDILPAAFVSDPARRVEIARMILSQLPEWFGIPAATEGYITDAAHEPCFVCEKDGAPVGFLCLKETGRSTVELAVMGVLKPCHRKGYGRALVDAAVAYARQTGYEFMQVKTVQMGKYEEYDRTNRFYLSCGFKEFEVFPTLWDKWNPCQIYVLSLNR